MKIFITGSSERMAEVRPLLENKGEVTFHDAELPRPDKMRDYDLFIDLNLDEQPENLECKLAGMNLLPTFINRSRAEVSLLNPEDKAAFGEAFQQLGWQPEWIEDRIGMVTPRIVFMIINEACYTVQEGTAGMDDIDQSMKLGTNYPQGPFEWSRRVGLRNVYETLEAIYQDTHEERYKICPLLKRKYLKGEQL